MFAKIAIALALSFALATAAAPSVAHAQAAPLASGTVRAPNGGAGAPMARFDVFASSGVVPFTILITLPGEDKVIEITPTSVTAAGDVACGWTMSQIIGQPSRGDGWPKGDKILGGTCLINASTSTPTAVSLTLTETNRQVGYHSVPSPNTTPMDLILTIP